MPPWGRPSGGWGRNKRDRERQRKWEESVRFEELESDDDDSAGVDLERPFSSDELLFTGADLASRPQNRRKYSYTDNSEEGEAGVAIAGQGNQLALREKEDVLVQRAMERIRRAQRLGKPNVKLTPLERDALERVLEADRAAENKAATSSKKSSRKSSRSSLVPKTQKRQNSKSSLTHPDEFPNPPGMVVAGPDGNPIYAPIGYYPPAQYASHSQPTSRSGSQSLQPSPPMPQSPYGRSPPKRFFSGPETLTSSSSRQPAPEAPRPLSDEADWQSRPRSSPSNNYPPYGIDPYGYPYPPPHHSQPSPSGYSAYRPSAQGYGSASDPALQRVGHSSGGARRFSSNSRRPSDDITPSGSESDEESDESGQGVEVDVVPAGQGYEVVSLRQNSGSGPSGNRHRKGRR